MEPSKSIEEHIKKELDKLEKLLKSERSPVSVHLIITGAHVHANPHIEVRLDSPHFHLKAQEEGADVHKEPHIFKAIDIVITKMLRQLHDAKSRLTEENHTSANSGKKL